MKKYIIIIILLMLCSSNPGTMVYNNFIYYKVLL